MIENHNWRNGEYNFNDDTGHYDWLENTGFLYQGSVRDPPTISPDSPPRGQDTQALILGVRPGWTSQFTYVSI